MVKRIANITKSHSFFLFGNRGVGKSTWLRQRYPPDKHLWFDLLDRRLEHDLLLRPQLMGERLAKEEESYPRGSYVVIDEVQKIPELLNVVHQYIEKKHFLFALTGSSARKLRRQGVNLLAGRAFVYYLFPLTHLELGNEFDLMNVLRWGSLPMLLDLSEEASKVEYLLAYTQTYLQEEIVAEQLVRRVVAFRQFLEVAAQSNSKIVNYQKIASDVGVEIPTVQNYFSILEDTFTGFLLPPFDRSIRKRQRKNPKFYFFDLGVTRCLQNRMNLGLAPGTFEFGELFEQFIILEFIRLNYYFRKSFRLSYLMTQSRVEIDLVVERPGQSTLFIEIKSTDTIGELKAEKLTGFKKIVEAFQNGEGWVISRDPVSRIEEGIRFAPWESAVQEIFALTSG